MYDILGFPERYRIKKKLGKDRYMKHGNLTAIEKKLLDAYLANVDLLYAIPCNDGSEIVIVSVEPELPTIKQPYFISNIARTVAQSFPYLCMVIMHCQGIIKFIVFDERSNKKSNNRLVADGCYATPDLVLSENCREIKNLAEILRTSLNHRSSAQELHESWKDAIVQCAGSESLASAYALANGSSLCYSVEKAQESRKREKAYSALFEDEYDDRFDDYSDQFYICDYNEDTQENDDYPQETLFGIHIEQDQSDLFDGRVLKYDDSAETDLFIDFCSAHCWPLFNEAAEAYYEDIIPRIWLTDYFDACNRCAEDYFGKSINSAAAYRIRNAFENQETPTNDYYGSFNVDDLKSHLWRYFDE